MEWKGPAKYDGKEGTFMTFIMGWVTSNDKAAGKNGSWIQNWAQWEDPKATGKYQQMTCNVLFDNTKKVAPPENVLVNETYGTTIDAATITGVLGAPGLIGSTVEDKKIGWHSCDKGDGSASDEEAYAECYKTESTATSSS